MQNLENDLVMLQGRVDAVAMYYGMCGNYGMDLTEWAEENLDYPVATFRDTARMMLMPTVMSTLFW